MRRVRIFQLELERRRLLPIKDNLEDVNILVCEKLGFPVQVNGFHFDSSAYAWTFKVEKV